eukprot:1979517-Pyramimonas_sp.AAC.1
MTCPYKESIGVRAVANPRGEDKKQREGARGPCTASDGSVRKGDRQPMHASKEWTAFDVKYSLIHL